jgi:hypothetical protein
MATVTHTTPRIKFTACLFIVSIVQYLAIVLKLSAGKNTHVSSFAITLLELEGSIFVLFAANPTAIQRNKVSIGLSVAKKIFSIFPPKISNSDYRSYKNKISYQSQKLIYVNSITLLS